MTVIESAYKLCPFDLEPRCAECGLTCAMFDNPTASDPGTWVCAGCGDLQSTDRGEYRDDSDPRCKKCKRRSGRYQSRSRTPNSEIGPTDQAALKTSDSYLKTGESHPHEVED